MRIYKYTLEVVDQQVVIMSYDAKMLSAQMQNGQLQLWALVDETSTAKKSVTIAIYGTGNPMPNKPGEYISTFQMADGKLVFHVFHSPGI